jgi:hypothetical protein
MFSKKYEIVPVKYKKLYTIYVFRQLGTGFIRWHASPTRFAQVGAGLPAKASGGIRTEIEPLPILALL